MRSIHWLFIVSVALFVSGIGFVIAAERNQRHKGPVDSSITLTPVASIKQIMRGIVTLLVRIFEEIRPHGIFADHRAIRRWTSPVDTRRSLPT